MHQSSLAHMLTFRRKYLDKRKNEELLILDLGSLDVNGSYREYFHNSPWKYRGMDTVPGKNVDVVLENPYRWKEIRSNSADVLISGQAFEHIEFFWITMLEVARALKPGGLCCIIAPSGGPEHRYPVDCWRFFPDGFAALAHFARLHLLEVSTNKGEVSENVTDDSSTWSDTILVCRKPNLSALKEVWQRISRWLLSWIMLQRIEALLLDQTPSTTQRP